MLWDLPAIFTVLELNSMMPVEGGYYKWVKHALGTRWGFYEGWWTWLYTFADLADLPPKLQEITWHRYQLIHPLIHLPSRQRTMQTSLFKMQ